MHATPKCTGCLCDFLLRTVAGQGFKAFFDHLEHSCDFFLVPGGYFLVSGKTMLKDHSPAVWVFIGKLNINLAQSQQVITGIAGFFLFPDHAYMQAVECTGVDVQNQVIQVFKNQVQGSDGVADGGHYLSCTQASIPLLHHDLLCGRQGHFPDFITAVIAASRHCADLLTIACRAG